MAESFDIKKKKKMIQGKRKERNPSTKKKRKERMLPLAPNKRSKLEDRLSGLPDDIIVSILSRLTLKEAVRTSVLSERWKNMWTWTTGSLDFHYSDKPSSDYIFDFHFMRRSILYQKAPLVEGRRFVARVNHVLSLHQGQTVDKFEISCNLVGRLRKTIINEWLEFALRKRVKSLKLYFRGKIPYARGYYSLKKALISKNSCDSLTVLDLKNVDVTGKSLSYILVKCQFLEELSVEESSTLVELRVPCPVPQLKSLKIKNCFFLKYLEICAVNLKSFAYHGELIPVIFEKAPRLIEASYGRGYASFITANVTGKFSSYASCLESLVLDTNIISNYLNDGVLPEFPVLENLRQLYLGSCEDTVRVINLCASLLKRCPILERLSLKARSERSGEGDLRTPESKDKCLHSSLRVIELVNVHGYVRLQTEIACDMVSRLPSLEQVIIRIPKFGYFLCDEKKETAKREANELADSLSKIMPPTAELIIVSS